MARLIDADDFEHRFKKMLALSFIHSTIGSIFFSCIRSQPTIDPVKHGHWILKGRDNGDCSVCESNTDFPLMCCYGSPSTRYEPYPCCPWCGAKMDEEVSNADH